MDYDAWFLATTSKPICYQNKLMDQGKLMDSAIVIYCNAKLEEPFADIVVSINIRSNRFVYYDESWYQVVSYSYNSSEMLSITCFDSMLLDHYKKLITISIFE